jgi:hypothetical protein
MTFFERMTALLGMVGQPLAALLKSVFVDREVLGDAENADPVGTYLQARDADL